MANAAEKAEARRVLRSLIEDDEPAAEAFVPVAPPRGLALLACALEDYAGSMPPWWRGLGLLLCAVVAAYLPVSVAVFAALVLPLAARWWTSRRLKRANRRIDDGRDQGGRAVRAVTVRTRARRAASVAGVVGVWLLAGSAVSHAAGYSSTAGLVFWTGSAGAWAVVFVPRWNAARARREESPDRNFDPELEAEVPPELTLELPAELRPEPSAQVPVPSAPKFRPADRNFDRNFDTPPPVDDTLQLPVTRPAELPVPADPEVPVGTAGDGYRLPPLALLAAGTTPPRRAPTATSPHAKTITGVLLEHNVGGRVVDSIPGPTVTRHVIVLNRGVKVEQFRRLAPDLQKALRTTQPVAVVDAIPGRDAVALDVPNPVRGVVTLGDLLRAARAELAGYALGLGLGFTVDGSPVAVDLAKLPHLLVAGATGAGKSTELNALIVGLLMQHTPATLGLALIDPKRVELAKYKRLPHLIAPIARGYDEAVAMFEQLVAEMERRYELLEDAGCRNVVEYNTKVAAGQAAGPPLRALVIVVDELADLMLVNKARRRAAKRGEPLDPDLEDLVVRLLQLARAAEEHLVLATQRPSVDVITGLIKANLPAHLAFAVAERADSMVILDRAGAEKLLGMGDALWQPQGNAVHRIQGASVTDREIDAVVAHCVAQAEPTFDLPSATPQSSATPLVEPVPVAPLEPPAREVVYAAAVAQAVNGRVDKRSIVAATPGMRPGTRDKALTDLAGPDDGRLVRVENTRGGYRITGDMTPEGTPDVDGPGPSGDGAQT